MPIEIATPDKLEYIFYPTHGRQFNFEVRAPHDAHLALTSGPEAVNPMYEIFIGGWNNSKSVIRKNQTKPDVVEASTPDILTNSEFKKFWVRWSDNVLKVGFVGDDSPFLSYDIDEVFPINFVGVCSGWGASASWIIDDAPAESTPECGGGSSGCWVPAASGVVPPNAVEGGVDGDEQLYIARAQHEGDLIPGKLHPSHGVCYVAWGGGEHGHGEYEVLCAAEGQWVPVTDGNIPPNALPAGRTADGESLFIGRATNDGAITIGKVQPSHSCCYISYGGEELSFQEFEVYVC